MGPGSDLWNQFVTMFCKGDFAGLGALFAVDAVHVDPVGRHEGRDAIDKRISEPIPAAAKLPAGRRG